MKLLQIYNQYRSLFGGEETVLMMTAALVEKHGGQTRLLMRSSRGMEKDLRKKIRAFCGGFYSFDAIREVSRVLADYRPDVVHAHNLYPLFSPSALVACRRAGVPVVVSFHNHAQTCPKTDHLRNGQICELCAGGHEVHCLLNNCRGNMFESIAYAGRSYFARRMSLFKDNTDIFVLLTQFAKQKLIDVGFDEERIRVLPNMVDLDRPVVDPAKGQYIAFVGRMSHEKGIQTLLGTARHMPNMSFRLAGGGPMFEQLKATAPENANFVGQLNDQEMRNFYAGARMIVLPSECLEMCPLVISEANSHGLPVVASRIGGIPELVDHGETGLLFEPGNVKDLKDKIHMLLDDVELCRTMGKAGRKKAVEQYGEDTYYGKLTAIYNEAIGSKVFSSN